MAFKLPFKLPALGKKSTSEPAHSTVLDLQPSARPAKKKKPEIGPGKLPVIGGQTMAQQLRILGTVFGISLAIAAGATLFDFQQARDGSVLAAASGQVRTLSQQPR